MKQIFTLCFFLFSFSTLFAQTLYTRNDTIAITQDSVTLQAGQFRGTLQWQHSLDGKAWNNLNEENKQMLKVVKTAEGYYRAEIVDNTCNPAYSDTALIGLPKLDVTTLQSTKITQTTAILNADVELKNFAQVYERGFYLSSENIEPTSKDSIIVISSVDSLFRIKVEGLKMKTNYYFKAFASCETGNYTGSAMSFKTDSSNITIMVNASDPLILTAKAEDGYSIDIYGQRDSVGIPTVMEQYVVKDSTGLETVYYLDNQKRPIKIIAPNGTIFNLTWITNDRIALNIIANNNETQLNTEINLSNEPLDSIIGQSSSVGLKSQQVINHTNTYYQPCRFYVDKCDRGFNGEVWIEISSATTGNLIRKAYASKISPGFYEAQIPNDLAPSLKISDVCSSIVKVLGKACSLGGSDLELTTSICVYASAAVASSIIGAEAAPGILAGCEAISTGLFIYCNTLGASVEGGTSWADILCEANKAEIKLSDKIKLTGVVKGSPYNHYSVSKIVSAGGPFPDLEISLDPNPEITKLYTTPSAALISDSYQIVSQTSCLPSGSVIELSVDGSDNYSDNVTYVVTEDNSSDEFRLTVPATKKGVVDICTVKVTLPDKSVLTKKEEFRHVMNAENRMKNYHIVVVQGDKQQGKPGAKLPLPIIVQVLDEMNKPVAGEQVYFESEYYPGNYSGITTREDGKVAVAWTLDNVEGTQKIIVFLKDNSGNKIEASAVTITAEAEAKVPVVSTNSVSNITETSATCGGNVVDDDGGAEITARGICWNTIGTPTVDDNKTLNGTGIGEFTSGLSGLTSGTTYYIRAYATNSKGTAYGNQISFTTSSAITITTASVTNITASSAMCGGTITSNKTITARGVCWNTTGNPTILNSKTSDGSGTGSFTSFLTNLSKNTTYYVRAYANYSNGVEYGNQLSFKTEGCFDYTKAGTALKITNVCNGIDIWDPYEVYYPLKQYQIVFGRTNDQYHFNGKNCMTHKFKTDNFTTESQSIRVYGFDDSGKYQSYVEIWDLEKLEVIANNHSNPDETVYFKAKPNTTYGVIAWYQDNSQRSLDIYIWNNDWAGK